VDCEVTKKEGVKRKPTPTRPQPTKRSKGRVKGKRESVPLTGSKRTPWGGEKSNRKLIMYKGALKGQKPGKTEKRGNAVTLGRHCYR